MNERTFLVAAVWKRYRQKLPGPGFKPDAWLYWSRIFLLFLRSFRQICRVPIWHHEQYVLQLFRLTFHSSFYYYQLDTQISCSLTQITLIKILYMFRAHSAHHQEVHDANCTYAASGIVTPCKWLSCATTERLHKTVTCREWRYQRLHMYNLRRGPPDDGRNALETCRGF